MNPIKLEQLLQTGTPAFPPAADRAAWEGVDPTQRQQLLVCAETVAATPIPALPATLYLDCKRTGQREPYQQPQGERRQRLAALTMAECLEYAGRFLDPILDAAWAICEESTWVYPAHRVELPDPDHPTIDLGAAMTGLALAETVGLLRDELEPALVKRIRHELEWRLFVPYLERHDHWWLFEDRELNNWTAVCTGGVVSAAIWMLEDKPRLARLIDRALRSLEDYLATFDPDGGSSEGPGYWSYGFGYFVVAAHLIAQVTGGAIDLFEREDVRNIAQFPLRTMLSPGHYAPFSDCGLDITYPSGLTHFLAQRLDLPGLVAIDCHKPGAAEREGEVQWALRNLMWRAEGAASFRPAEHDWYRGLMWMVSRLDPGDPDALVLAVKGGHNDEMHNQNDVGNLVVHLRGENIIADLGRPVYTLNYFKPAHRYEHILANSRGHSVPVVNGHLQRPGREAAARLIQHQPDRVMFELKACYPAEADLDLLRRCVQLDREAGGVVLEDVVCFANGAGTFQSVLITTGQVEPGTDAVILRGERGALRVGYDPTIVTPRIETVTVDDMPDGPTTMKRLIFETPTPVNTATVRLEVQPV